MGLVLIGLGIFISLFIGHWITRGFHAALYELLFEEKGPKSVKNLTVLIKSIKERLFGEYPETLKIYFPTTFGVPNWLIGHIERIFFTLAVTFYIPGTLVAMTGWITVKMVTFWVAIIGAKTNGNEADETNGNKTKKENYAKTYIALSTCMISMLFAVIGGLLIKWGIDLIKGG